MTQSSRCWASAELFPLLCHGLLLALLGWWSALPKDELVLALWQFLLRL